VGIIGTGRVGAVLGAALSRAGHPVVAASAVSDLSRLRAEALLPGTPIVAVDQVSEHADLVLVAVPDDVLADLVSGLAASGGVRAGQFWMHPCAGVGTAALASVEEQGAVPLAIHPVMTFTGTTVDLARLEDCPFAVTAPDRFRAVAEALVVEMGGDPVWVPEESRALYHAALSYGGNYLVTLVAGTLQLLEEAGIATPARLVAPLLSASLDNALRSGDQALTGPIARGDSQSVARQLSAVRAVSEQAAWGFRTLGAITADRAIAAGLLSSKQAEGLLAALGTIGERDVR